MITEADTLDQVQANVADALAALIEMYEDLGKPLSPALQPLATSLGVPIWVEALISVAAA